MNDGQYTNLRNFLEEIASQNKQMLAEQRRTNELLEQAATKTVSQDAPTVPPTVGTKPTVNRNSR